MVLPESRMAKVKSAVSLSFIEENQIAIVALVVRHAGNDADAEAGSDISLDDIGVGCRQSQVRLFAGLGERDVQW